MNRVFLFPLFALLALCSACARVLLPVDADMTIDLSRAGSTAEKEFRIWVQEDYRVRWHFQTSGGVKDNEVHKYLLGKFSSKKPRLGASLPVHLTLVRVRSGGDTVFYDEDLTVQCSSLAPGGRFIIGNVFVVPLPLDPGKYRLKITNLKDHPRLQYVPTTIYVTYGRKF